MISEALNVCQRKGMGTRGFFIIGLPGDTKETMQKTIDFAKSLPLDVAGFYVTIPFPGTELTETAKKSGELMISEHDYFHYDQFLMNLPDRLYYIPKGLDEKTIRKFQKKAYHQFYIRLGYLFRQLRKVRGIKELANKIKAFLVIRKI